MKKIIIIGFIISLTLVLGLYFFTKNRNSTGLLKYDKKIDTTYESSGKLIKLGDNLFLIDKITNTLYVINREVNKLKELHKYSSFILDASSDDENIYVLTSKDENTTLHTYHNSDLSSTTEQKELNVSELSSFVGNELPLTLVRDQLILSNSIHVPFKDIDTAIPEILRRAKENNLLDTIQFSEKYEFKKSFVNDDNCVVEDFGSVQNKSVITVSECFGKEKSIYRVDKQRKVMSDAAIYERLLSINENTALLLYDGLNSQQVQELVVVGKDGKVIRNRILSDEKIISAITFQNKYFILLVKNEKELIIERW